MSTGGIFTLITNEGKQDRLLLATELLNDRLLSITNMRRDQGQADDTPTLTDIERTHILFTNAHFKPYCAIAYEYMKSTISSGVTLGSTQLQISIPQFGDFFNDMVLRIVLGSVTATNSTYWTAPAANPARGAELLAYVDYVGERLVKRVQFTVNSNNLDQYTSQVHNFQQKYFVTPNKQAGWDRNVQQEVPHVGYCDVQSQSGSPAVPLSFTGRGAGVREVKQFVDGPQTPKVTQPSLEFYIPLLFWFNTDPRLSIPSVSIPYGQRFIYIDLAPANEILQHLHAWDPALDAPASNPVNVPDVNAFELYINNLFVNPEVHDIFIKRIGFSLIRVHLQQEQLVSQATNSILMSLLKWPVETIYIGFLPTTNYSTASSTMLNSWYKFSYNTNVTVQCCCLANSFLWNDAALPASPVTADLTAAFQPTTGAGGVLFDHFGVVGVPTFAQVNDILVYYGYETITNFPVGFTNASPVTKTALLASVPSSQCECTYQYNQPVIDTLGVQAHGINLYNPTPAQFYNNYISYTYGGQMINTPYDVGAYMITFNLYPCHYQPSGYINISRAREFYINYTSSLIGSTVPTANMVVLAIAINFLLISDGTAILRYST